MNELSERLAALSPAQRALLERELEKRRVKAPAAARRLITPRPPAAHYPLSVDQERIFFTHYLHPDKPYYNVYEVIRFQGFLDAGVLTRSLNEIVRRHEILRTLFTVVDGQAVQIVTPALSVTLPLVNLEGLSATDRETEARRIYTEALKAPFDLLRLPLFRTFLIRVAADENICPIVFHHLVIDWVSFHDFQRELVVLYEAFTQGRPSPLPEPRIQYADYAVWQRRQPTEELWGRQLDYWREKLRDAPHLTELPGDRPRLPMPSGHGRRQDLALQKAVSDDLRRLAQSAGATLNMALLAAFKALICRLSGQTKVIVGVPIATHNQTDLKGLLGFFINQLVLYTDLDGDPSFAEVVDRVRATTLGAFANKDVPFGRVVETVLKERDMSRVAITQLVFLFLNPQEFKNPQISGLTFVPCPFDGESTEFDMTFSLWDKASGFDGWMEYNTDLFDPTTVVRFTEGFKNLMGAAMEDPHRPLSRLPLLSPGGRHQLLVEWQAVDAPPPGASGVLHGAFELWARRCPDRVAMVTDALSGGAALSYRELERRAEGLARRLRARGASRGSRLAPVALCVERSPELVVAVLGILEAGAAFLPLDPALPRQRLALLLEDSGARVVVTQESLRALWRELDVQAVLLDRPAGSGRDAGGDVRAGDLGRPAPPDPRSPAYVIYTSGSTGRPKGVSVSHAAVGEHVGSMIEHLALGPGDRLLQFASAGFDPFVEQVLGPLSCGATLVLRGAEVWPPAELGPRLAALDVTMVELPTPYLQEWIQQQNLLDAAAPRSLRRLLTGGEAMRPEPARRLPRGWPAPWNFYGPTEAVIGATVYPLPAAGLAPGALRVPIGRPLSGRAVYVLDRRGFPAALGSPGELWLGGRCLARGYLGRPGLTADRFRPDAFRRDAAGSRVYRTGDLARLLADGNLDFLGRADHQVKVRGQRIELREIEATLEAHPAISEAVVTAREDPEADSRPARLVAYVVPVGPQDGQPDRWRRYLKERLPEAMVPAAFVALAELPRTATGKVDRGALPAPGLESESSRPPDRELVAPRDATEKALAAIWCRVLGLERVGVHDNFFASGGDSILSMQVVFQANQQGLRLTPDALFHHQSLAELARVTDPGARSAAADHEQGPVGGELPLTPIQSWFLDADPVAPHHFNQAVLLTARWPMDPGLLARAVDRLLEHHDALRTRFARSREGWRARVAAREEGTVFSRFDLEALRPGRRSAAVEAICRDLQASLSLSAGPIVRVAWFQLGGTEPHRLLVVIHHLVVDAVSWRVLLEDLRTAYEGGALPLKSTSFLSWARRLRDASADHPAVRDAERGRAALPRLPPRLPVDRDTAAGDDPAGAVASTRTVTVSLGRTGTRQLLRQVPEAYRTQVDEVLLTALLQAFAGWTGDPRLRLDAEGHGRDAGALEDLLGPVDLSRTVGWFTVVYPLLLELPASAGDPGSALKTVKETLRRVPRQGLMLPAPTDSAGAPPEGDKRGTTAPAEVSFNYLGQLDAGQGSDSPFAPAPESAGANRARRAPRPYLLEIDGSIAGGELRMTFAFSRDRHRRATVEALAEAFLGRLQDLVEHCLSPEAGGATPSDFPLAGVDQALLDRLAATGTDLVDLYPLTPLQQGMLFDHLLAPDSGVYHQQLDCELLGALDQDAFEAAWRQVVERHPVLRTTFLWRGLEAPLQVVHRRAEVSVACHDWRDLPAAGLERRLADFLAEDRRRGFDLEAAPPSRLALIRLGDGRRHFVWSHHHLLLDGWSTPRVLQEVLEIYGAARAGRPPELGPARPFRDFVAWLRRQDRAAAEAYWRRTLRGLEAPTSLGHGGPAGRRPAAGEETGTCQQRLPEALTAALDAAARRLKLTLNTLVQGAWALLLARTGAASEVLFGVTVSGRPTELEGADSMVGMLINSLPVRVRIAPEQPLDRWLTELQEQQVELRRHQHVSLVDVQGWSDVPRGTPLFENLFLFQNYPVAPSLGRLPGGLSVRRVRTLEQTDLPLVLYALPGSELTLKAAYDRRPFDELTVRRTLGHLRNLLADLAAADLPPAGEAPRRLGELALLSPAERHHVTVEWNATAARYPREASVFELFAGRAEAAPDAVALAAASDPPTDGDVAHLSYGELSRRAGALGRELRDLGVGPEVVVGLCLERSGAMVVGMLGILAAGGAYLPLDPTDPPERLAWVLDDVAAPWVLTRPGTPRTLGGARARRLELAADGRLPRTRAPSRDPVPAAAAAHLAYVISTSGSTGRPKGVGVSHRGVVRLVNGSDYVRLGPEEVLLHFAPPSFDASTFEIWGALLRGGRLVVPPAGPMSPEELGRWLASHRVSTLWLTAGLFHQVVDGSLHSLRGLRQLLAGGDVLPVPQVRRVLEELPGMSLVNGYGPTEGTTFTCCHRMNGPRDLPGSVPIGRPIANTRVFVVDARLDQVPAGIAGELLIGGDGVARGYFGRPALTAEQFVPDPFPDPAGAAGRRLYKSGDLTRALAGGEIEFLGRRDHQVKIRGFRVEIDEIAARLRRHPSVRKAAVVTRPGPDGDKRLVAYVVTRGEPAGDGELSGRLRRFLSERLPDYMVPAAIVPLAALPLTPQGKIDRAALSALPAPGLAATADFVAPRSPREEILAGIWREVLDRRRIGVHDDFFELGGHSLVATRVVSRIRRTLSVELPLAALFEAPTVARLAAAIASRERAEAGRPGLPPIVRETDPGRRSPLSFAQQRLWFLDQLEPGSASYNVPAAFHLTGRLSPRDLAAFAGALRELVRRHEVLRTRFVAVHGRPVQVIDPPPPPAKSPRPCLIDLAGLTGGPREAELRRLLRHEARRPFDLSRGPLLRLRLVRLAGDEHVLQVTQHHIGTDGWSLGVFIHELAALYEAASRGRPSPLPELPVQYADFARWQRRWLRGEVLERQLAYWRERLAVPPAPLELPSDRPRTAGHSGRGGQLVHCLGRDLSEALQALGRRSGATLFMTLLAGFKTLLWRLTGATDLAVGTPIANRGRLEIEGLIGFFVNTLVLRTELMPGPDEPTFEELLVRLREVTLGAYAHQDLPFERLVEELRPERDLDHSPLFQVMLALQNAPTSELAAAGLEMRPRVLAGGAARFELTLSLVETDDGLLAAAEYAADLFDATTIRRWLAHYETLLAGLSAAPGRRLSTVAVLRPGERHQLVREWNDSELPLAPPRLDELFEARARRAPEAVAIVWDGAFSDPHPRGSGRPEAALSYGELDRRANRLAHHLRAALAGSIVSLAPSREPRIAICLPRSPDLVVALVAVLKAGGTCLPLDPDAARERLALLLADSAASVLVTRQDTSAASALPLTTRVVDLDLERPAIRGHPETRPPGLSREPPGATEAGTATAAYAIYTSGSTGTPKGVLLSHRSLGAYLAAAVAELGLGSGDRVLQFADPTFDVSILEIFGALTGGATLVLRGESRDHTALAPAAFLEACAASRLTVLKLPTAFWHQLADELGRSAGGRAAAIRLPSSLRLVLPGGEKMAADRLARWRRHAGSGARLIHTYGPTEATVGATRWRPRRTHAKAEEEVLIGRPLPNVQALVVDPRLRPVPIGVAGELALGGIGLARGYLGRPGLTAAAFVPHPLRRPGGRLYRSGDLARGRADGQLEFLGRRDRQLKVRGFRIEPGEVEAVLRRHPAVAEAVVTRRGSGPQARLVAYLVRAEEDAATAPEADGASVPADLLPPAAVDLASVLTPVLSDHLPAYMVPSAFVVLDALPLSASGKVDSAALPDPEAGRSGPRAAYAPPRTPVEELLADLWTEVLEIETAGRDDNFFDLGGHSLLATQVISRLRQTFGVELPLRELFEAPTIAQLAGRIAAADVEHRAPPLSTEPAPARGLPLSFAQERLWFLDRLVPDNPFYNMYNALRASGRLDTAALEAAAGVLVARHAGLRTTFRAPGGEPRQAVARELRLGLPRVDLEALSAAGRASELAGLAAAEVRRPFDLARGPLLRLTLVRLEGREHVLLLSIHHIVSDGWSQGIFYDELAVLYEACRAGTAPAAAAALLPELPIQYPDFALWQRRWLRGEALEEQLGYWRRRLEGMPPVLELPFDRPRPAVETFRGGQRHFRLPATLLGALRRLGRDRDATLSMVLLAAFKVLLSRLSGQLDLAIGTAVANRTRREVENLIGFFVNTLVLRTDLGGSPSFEQVVERVREAALGAYTHQDLPFEKLVEELQPERDLSHNPLIQVMVGFQNYPSRVSRLRHLTLSPLEPAAIDSGTSKFDLTLFLAEEEDELAGILEYNHDLFDRTTIHRLLAHFENLLRAVAGAPASAVAGLPLLDAGERHQLLTEWNDAAAAYPRQASLAELFARRAAAAPDAVAVVFGERTVSYGELDRHSGVLAGRLLAEGLEPETPVALDMERSLPLVVAMLAVVRAGDAYLPLDPDMPAERRSFMLADSGARLALSAGQVAAARAGADAPALERGAGGERLAYVIYTSGSTGRPKGVAVTQRAVARLVLDADYVRLGPGDRVAQLANASFDAATFEIWGALLTGACLVGLGPSTLSPGALKRRLRRHRISTLFVTTALFNQLVRDAPGAFADLREVLFGGEAVDAGAVRQLLSAEPPRRLLHVYGPTENTTFTSWHPVRSAAGATVPIGRPIANSRVHVVEPGGEPAPAGVAGELVIGDDGLARGYLGRPARTAEQFVPDPFVAAEARRAAGGRLYRTGDLVRRRADGDVVFLGRRDHQVKLRGFRIELGEIEAVLAEHPAVRDCVVQPRRDVPGEPASLVAYVVAQARAAETAGAEDEGEQVADWRMIFDDLYRREPGPAPVEPDPTFNHVGWDSTATGEPLPAEEMREWLDDTVGRVLALEAIRRAGGKARVLEIGCGTGMLLYRVAPHCESYVGIDVSETVLEDLAAELEKRPEELPQVRLLERPADRLDDLGRGVFDVVILNSVVQYFPGADYLLRVLEAAARPLRPGGVIFLGDLRSLPLLEAFHTSVELARAEPELGAVELRRRVRARRREESELALDPAFFSALERRLPRIRRVDVFPKRGRAHNELTAFRYQVVLRLDESPPATPAPATIDWRRQGLSLARLRRRLEQDGPPAARLTGVPNARVAGAVEAAQALARGDLATAGQLQAAGTAEGGAAAEAVDPQRLWDLGRELPYEVELGWANPGAEGLLDAVFLRRQPGEPRPDPAAWLPEPVPPADGAPASALVNRPARRAPTAQARDARFTRQVVPELRAWLAGKLPEYMVPSRFVSLEALPLGATAKVDRGALPAPDASRPELAAAFVAPRDATEELLAEIWTTLLGVERIGVDDDFFELGGHSLLATRVVSRVRQVYDLELPLRALFEAPTIRALADRLRRPTTLEPELPPAPAIAPRPRGEVPPLSFAQERLWFLHRFDPALPLYNEAAVFRLSGALESAALRRALDALVGRHESLRTTFAQRDGEPFQAIAPAAPFELAEIDLKRLPGDVAETRVRRLAGPFSRPFDLTAGPLLRGLLVHLDELDHALLFNFHHVVFDGWSASVFSRELSAHYRAFAAGESSPLPPLPFQYGDFARWQRRWLSGPVLAAHLDYWRPRLADLPALDLPLDRPRPPVAGGPAGEETLRLSPSLTGALRGLGREHGVTLFMVLLAAFKTLLARACGLEDVVVGSPIANRNRPGLEEQIGFFINLLVLRTDLRREGSRELSGAELLAHVREVALGAYGHQDLPFEKLVEELRPPRDPSRHPLFQISFQLLNTPPARLELPGLTPRPHPLPARWANFDLDVIVMEAGAGLTGSLKYRADLFDHTTIRRFLGHFERLLEGLAADPDRPLSAFPTLSTSERQQVAREWAGPARGDGVREDLWRPAHELVERQAARRPSAVALLWRDVHATYRELDRRADRLAQRLRRRLIDRGALVAVAMERSPELVVALLAVWKAGASYLPVDPGTPRQRVSLLLRDARADLLLTETSLLQGPLQGLPESVPILIHRAAAPLGDAEASGVPPSGTLPEELAYVIYTSGSTGRPKGVEVAHGALSNLLESMGRRFPLGPGDAFLAVTTPSFDITALELFLPLVRGARVVLAEADAAVDGARLAALWQRSGARFMQATPATWQLLLTAGWTGDPGLTLLCGGEALSRELARRLLGRAGEVWNLYGPTETTVWSSASRLPEAGGAADPSIGRAIERTRIHLVDRRLRTVPAGVAGELLIGGRGVARGYRHRPHRTAECFVPDPFAETSGERLYRTGDLARWLGDGLLDFLGRRDHQVKVRGFRIEPGEIEAALTRHPAVRQAVVAARPDASGDRRLVAYLVAAGDHEPSAEPSVLRDFLRRLLPDYMVPSAFVTLEAFPLTPSGKVDRQALPSPDGARPDLARELVAPRDPGEERLAAIWREVLGVEEIGVFDDFFDLGGHSLLATRVLSRVETAFGVTLPVRDLFDAPTVAAMAAGIDKRRGSPSVAPPSAPIRPLARGSRRVKRSSLEP